MTPIAKNLERLTQIINEQKAEIAALKERLEPVEVNEIINDFISKFCNDHNGEIRFLRSIFYDEKDGAEEIIKFIREALSKGATR